MARKTKDTEFADASAKSTNDDKFRASVRGAFNDFPDPREALRCVYPSKFMFLVIVSGYLSGGHTEL